MTVEERVAGIAGFSSWSHADKIRFLAWHLHTEGHPAFTLAQLRRCYDDLGVDPPASFSSFTRAMVERKPREALPSAGGYILERRVREGFDAKYGNRPTAIIVDKLLAELPARVESPIEKVFLDEALTCFRGKAFRAAIVMTWNLAFDHLCKWILANDLAAFNVQLPKSFPKAEISSVAKREDFEELKESQILQVCKSANIITGSLHKILKEKLDRRNVAAHPSQVVVSQLTAEEFIKDVVENVVLSLK